MLLLVKVAQALGDRLCGWSDVQGVLGDLPGDAWHVRRFPCKEVLVGSEKVNERAFLFLGKRCPDPDLLGWVSGVEQYLLRVLRGLEGTASGLGSFGGWLALWTPRETRRDRSWRARICRLP